MKEQQNIIIYNTADGKAKVSLYAKDWQHLDELKIPKKNLNSW